MRNGIPGRQPSYTQKLALFGVGKVVRGGGPHVCAIGEFEIEFLVADSSVVFVEFVKLSFLKEEDCVPEILFDFPDQS
jgi:hypothetical protein